MAAHSLTPAAATIASISVSRPNRKVQYAPSHVMVRAQASDDSCPSLVQGNPQINRRRNIALGLAGALVGGLWRGEQKEAWAAARRPPPPPPAEKKDPNVSGVQAKVLASRKRKEAMKEEMAKLREKGKAKAKEAAVLNVDTLPRPIETTQASSD